MMLSPHRELNEKCAVFAVFAPKLDVARVSYFGLYALQHRGQESSGIVTSDGRQLYTHRGQGLVSHVYQDADLDALPGYMAIGHNRYSTSGGASVDYIQPVIIPELNFALAHNGNLPSVAALERFLDEQGIDHAGANDTRLMAQTVGHYLSGGLSLADAVERCYPLFTGAFSCVALTARELVVFRDAHGVRPLSIGNLGDGWVVASESCAFDTVGAKFWRDVRPGEILTIVKDGLSSRQVAAPDQKLDIFELVYFARPDSWLMGRRVNETRREMGRLLAAEHPVAADVVVPMPDSAIPSALGYSQTSGIPFDYAIIKNRYIHRTFIRPSAKLRERDIPLKLNPLPEALAGKRVIVVDDSIVRGATTKKVVKTLYGAGAARVSVLISSPPVRYPDFYGIDTPRQSDLLAARLTVAEMAADIGCDYLGFLSYSGMIDATGAPADQFSTSCFNGVYPIDILERAHEVSELPPMF